MNNKKITILIPKNYLTTKEVSEVFDSQISVTTLNDLIRADLIPYVKQGRKKLIPTEFVITLLEQAKMTQCKSPNSKSKKKAVIPWISITINGSDVEILLNKR